jgi:hypothetical protein
LCADADELECCRSAEQQLRDEMSHAVRAAEAEAYKKAEDAYQEASYAGVTPCLLVLTLHFNRASATARLQLMLKQGRSLWSSIKAHPAGRASPEAGLVPQTSLLLWSANGPAPPAWLIC